MAYLDRQLSEYRTSASLINITSNNTVKNTQQIANKPVDEGKNSNYQLAKNLADSKANLVKALASFPITALWLIHKYEQNPSILDQESEDSSFPDNLTALLTEIQRIFFELLQYHQDDNKHSNDAAVNCKQRLISAIQLFPFPFEDLLDITEAVIYCAKTQGLLDQSVQHHCPKNVAGLIDKRLKTQPLPNRMKALEQFKVMVTAQYAQFWLLALSDDRRSDVATVVLTEHLWLKARQDLVMANNKLVSFIVNQYRGSFLDFNDLVQEGQTGLLKAVDRFDYRLGFQFSTYAGYWIRQAISRALSRSERPVRIPCEQVANINRVFRVKDQLTAQTGREANVQDIANHTQLSCEDINAILAIAQTAIPLEGDDDGDNEKTFAPVDFLEQQTFSHPIEEMAELELETLIAEAIKTLNPREAQVVCCHFGVHANSEMTLQEIGEELNLTRERIRQIQVIALNKIKLNYGQQLINFL